MAMSMSMLTSIYRQLFEIDEFRLRKEQFVWVDIDIRLMFFIKSLIWCFFALFISKSSAIFILVMP